MMIQMTLQQTSRVFKIVFTQIKYANLLSILFQSISLINVFFLHLGIAFLLLRCLFKSSFSACLPGIIFIFSSHSFKKIFIFTLFCFTILYWFCHILTCSYCSRQLIKQSALWPVIPITLIKSLFSLHLNKTVYFRIVSWLFPHLLYIFYKLHIIDYYWRRLWHPTLVLLPGKSHRQRSLVGCIPWGR